MNLTIEAAKNLSAAIEAIEVARVSLASVIEGLHGQVPLAYIDHMEETVRSLGTSRNVLVGRREQLVTESS